MSGDVTPSLRLALAASAALAAASVDLAQNARDAVDDLADDDIAAGLRLTEVTENIADALESVLRIELDESERTDVPQLRERIEAVGQLLGAVRRFLDRWA